MARAWLVDGRGIARKVSHASVPSALQINDCGASRECPKCHFLIDNSDVSPEWPGLPLGVKFEPSDEELVEHLSAKCGVENFVPHRFLDEFIPTLDGDLGINYTHPENLPGANKDGHSIFFFHKTANAYGTGQRKRRKIHSQNISTEEPVRWHKTGKTKAVMLKGVQKGSKKIMVLYRSSVKGSKPKKSNWVMHQYHLGTEDDEHGDYVVSKIFYQQQKQNEKNDDITVIEEADHLGFKTGPTTPNPNPPNPPRPGKSVICEDLVDETLPTSSFQGLEQIAELPNEQVSVLLHELHPADEVEDGIGYSDWLAGESQFVEEPVLLPEDPCLLAGESQAPEAPTLDQIDDSLLCKENVDLFSFWRTSSEMNQASNQNTDPNMNNNAGALCDGPFDFPNLDNIVPDLTDLQFCSQDSFLSWLDRL